MPTSMFKYSSYEAYCKMLIGRSTAAADQHRRYGVLWRGVLGRIGCSVCGLKDARFLEWNHRSPNEKKFHISSRYNYPFRTTLAEMRKCDVLCSACHKEETKRQRLIGEFSTKNLTVSKISREDWEAGRAAYLASKRKKEPA